ncbi:MAG: N-acetylneuraminate synthase [Nitrospina sp.]|nr:N-acetylneuraminate synthase [Nitrospina sp.]|tara:strand:- start:4300 stop:5127 length:828 start_codon:yes stop_codon:yes gene_type:complete
MVFITAEIGINHNGDLEIAKKLIDVAKNAGCDAVKFQKRTIDKVYTKEVLESPRDSPWGTTTRHQKEGLEFGEKEYSSIEQYCKERKIEWFASSWDIDSQLFLRKFSLNYNKVASAMLTNHELLNTIAEERKHTFISTGMSEIGQIKSAVDIFKKNNCPYELQHSNSSYPMKIEEANLRCIETLRNEFNCNVGYSGHEALGYLICVCAVMFGATSIERHITLDRTMYGSDQAASLEPQGLERLVRDIRRIDNILGDGVKRVWPSEIPVMKKLRNL